MFFSKKFLDELQNIELKKLVNFIKTFKDFNDDKKKISMNLKKIAINS